MSTTRRHATLIAHDKALEAAGAAIRLVLKVPSPLRPLADQVIRAASSTAISDSSPRQAGSTLTPRLSTGRCRVYSRSEEAGSPPRQWYRTATGPKSGDGLASRSRSTGW